MRGERVPFMMINRQLTTHLHIDTHLANEQNTIESVIFKILHEKLVFLKQFVNEWFKVRSHHLYKKQLMTRHCSQKFDFTITAEILALLLAYFHCQ